jgi:hypothetical protein
MTGRRDVVEQAVAPDLEDANGPFNTVRPTVYVPFGQGKLFLKGSGRIRRHIKCSFSSA